MKHLRQLGNFTNRTFYYEYFLDEVTDIIKTLPMGKNSHYRQYWYLIFEKVKCTPHMSD